MLFDIFVAPKTPKSTQKAVFGALGARYPKVLKKHSGKHFPARAPEHSCKWRLGSQLTTQRALRDRLMSRGKNCLPTVSRQFLTRNYPRPNCLFKCLPSCLSPTREGFLSSFKINPAVRVIARQVRDKNCLAAIFAPRHQSVSSGPLGRLKATSEF